MPTPLKDRRLLKPDPVKKLEKWYQTHQRLLPWRQTEDPYAIWISEVMLQQTQVATVIPYFERFMARFPTVQVLAKAKLPSVLSHWEGLGYYSRAKNLHAGAKHVVKYFQGRFPSDTKLLREIAGIGPYTAGAIASIAFNRRAALVDGNVQRVLARYFLIESPLEAGATQKKFWHHAQDWVDVCNRPRDFNQALMELGATLCSKGAPRCEQCPLRFECLAYRENRTADVPCKKKRAAPVDLWWLGLVLEHQNHIFLVKNGVDSWWSGLWDLPRLELTSKKELPTRVSSYLSQFKVDSHLPMGEKRHSVTHHRIHFFPQWLRMTKRPRSLPWPGRWVPREKLGGLAVSSLVRKTLRAS